MDLEDDTTILSTLKSFNTFISRPERPQLPSERSAGSGVLQSQYKRSMEILEAAERVQSQNRFLQLDQEKKQMELSHKRARFELEKAASNSARDFEHELDRNQDLLARVKKLEGREFEADKNLSDQVEENQVLRRNLEAVNKKLEERDTKLNTAEKTITSLKDDLRELRQKIQNQDLVFSAQTLEKQELQEQLDLQRRKYQEISQLCQTLQAAQSSCSEHIIKIKELERRLILQEQDMAIVKTIKSEAAKVTDLEKELKRLREENTFLRESRENYNLLKEEAEGLRKKLERMEKTKEELVNVELEKQLQAWENLGQSTGLNIRKPEDLSREVIQIQQREIALKEQNYTLNSRVRSVERLQSELRAELTQQCTKTMEEQKKREAQDALVRRLQKRVLLLTKERDGMRSILESYDSELATTEYSPQLNKRLREAEEVLQRTQNHNSEMEVSMFQDAQRHSYHKYAKDVEMELDSLKKQPASSPESSSSVSKEEENTLRKKIEDLEAERQRLEEQNNILEMRLERNNMQVGSNPPSSCSGFSFGSEEQKNQVLKPLYHEMLTFLGSKGSMQLMETEFSKTLGEMVDLHLHHQKSIPAFLSAVTLDLFGRQTTI
uniref:Mitotic arrest deficient 1 like 1 n=1 Tax=Oryzias sinensis TaxID=183150 RepID=A0A8C7ZPV5_9TELE